MDVNVFALSGTLLVTHGAVMLLGAGIATWAVRLSIRHDPQWWIERIRRDAAEHAK